MSRSLETVLLVGFAIMLNRPECRREADTRPREAPQVDATIELTGSGLGKPTTFGFAQLAGMKMAKLDNVLMRKSHEDDETTSWQGPPLESLLAAARLKPGAMTVTLEADDGYEVETSLDDLKDAVVALKDGEGRWLADLEAECALKLVPPHKPGNFWIVNLSRIMVEPAAGAGSVE